MTLLFELEKAGCSKSILKLILKPSKGSNFTHLSSKSTRTSSTIRINFLYADCSSIPADWIKNTKGEEDPSIIGTSAADRSTKRLSIPKPWSADMRCSTVWTLTPSCSKHDDNLVSDTRYGSTLISFGGLRSTRLKTIPVFGAAGLNTRETFFPVCKPIPVALTRFFNVRCLCIDLFVEVLS